MKPNLPQSITCALLLAAAMPASQAAVFFSDTFGDGSTINSATPAAPTPTSTAYQMLSTKSQTPTPSITSGDLQFGIASTSSGLFEIQALFAVNPIVLVLPGDNIQLTVVFTNTSGMFPASPGSSQFSIGLYNSGNIEPFTPLPGGTNATTGISLADYTQKWLGYVGQTLNGNSRIMTRPAQVTTTDGWNQELLFSGSSTSTYRSQTTVGSTTNTSVALTTGAAYTQVLSILRNSEDSLAITNTLYTGPDTSGAVVVSYGGIATNATLLTAGFNGLAFGYYPRVSGLANIIDVSSIVVSGSVTEISGPPEITQEPISASAPIGGACAFEVQASGYSMSYQWHRNGTNLLDGDNISGANSSTLIVSPVSATDLSSSYYVTINGAGGFSTNSVNVALSTRTAANLTWSGSFGTWDLNTTPAWNPGGVTFNYGDNVTFDDSGAANTLVTLQGNFLSASSVTVDASYAVTYILTGSGSFAGPGSLIYKGPGILDIRNANSYSGGTIISNDLAYLKLNNYNGLGTGPVRLSKAGGLMEIIPTGGASSGIRGDVIVEDDFRIQFDGTGSYGGVFLGNLAGTTGKILTLHPLTTTNSTRIRVYGPATVCDANLALDGLETPEAAYYGTTLAPYHGSGAQIYNGIISGPGGVIQRAGGLTVLAGQNTYAGGTTPTTGTIGFGADTVGAVTSGPIGIEPLFLNPEAPNTTGSGTVLAFGGARTIANPIQYSSATNNHTLIVGGTNDLTFSGPVTLNGNDGSSTYTTRFFDVRNTGLTTISGVISGTGFGLAKLGAGTLVLDNTMTYTGPTAVSNGTLRVNGQIGAGAVTVAGSGSTLGGSGSIGGAVSLVSGASLAPGADGSVGTLTINNDLSFDGNLAVDVNRAGSASDKAVVSGTLANTGTGTVTVNNLGAPLQAGDTFALFNKAVTGGENLTVTGGDVIWSNNLGANGTISVSSVVSSIPTNISYSFASGSMTLSWPISHLTWTLQSNSVSIANSSAWYPVPGSQSNTQMVFTVEPSKNVFFRLVK